MERNVLYTIGGLLALRGLIVAVWPRLLFRWAGHFRARFPAPMNRVIDDYARMSDLSLRILGAWLFTTGGLIVWLAARNGDKARPDLAGRYTGALRRS